MGTSQSSRGPGPGVPLVPPWVPPPPPPFPDGASPNQPPPPTSANPAQALPIAGPGSVPLAMPGRFGSARTYLGKFARSGEGTSLRRGVSDYVTKGYGGRSTAAKRLEGTARTAGALHGALSALVTGQQGEFSGSLSRSLLQGKSAREIIDAVLEAVRPVDGTQDAEASREAVNDSLSDLLERFPDADLLALTDDQRALVVETFTAEDLFRRLVLDVGKHIQDAAPTASEALSRLAQIRDYIREVISDSFTRLRDSGTPLTSGHVASTVRSALSAALEVFELTRL